MNKQTQTVIPWGQIDIGLEYRNIPLMRGVFQAAIGRLLPFMLLILMPLERPLLVIADLQRYRGPGALGVNILEFVLTKGCK